MNATLVATAAGLATAVLWGTSDYLAARGGKRLSPVQINFGVQVIGMFMLGLLWLVSDVHMPTMRQLLLITLAGTLITIAFLLFVKALSIGAVGVVSPLGNAYPIVTIVLSVLFLNQSFSHGQIGAMFGIVIGAGLLAYEKTTKKIPLHELHKVTLIALAAALIWGFAFFTLNPLVNELPWRSLNIIVSIVEAADGLLLMLIMYKGQTLGAIRKTLTTRAALAAGFVGTTGGILFYSGSSYGHSVLIPTVLSGAGPLVASILGAIFDGEKIGVAKRFGAVLLVAGIIVLNVT